MALSAEQSQDVIITGIIVAVGAAEIHRVGSASLTKDTGPPKSLVTPLIAGGALGVFLFGISAAGAPQVAAGFAITAAITSVLLNGADLFKVLAPYGGIPRPGQHIPDATTQDVTTIVAGAAG